MKNKSKFLFNTVKINIANDQCNDFQGEGI